MGNTPVVAKQDIAKYVQDMAEIETAEFTMRKAVAEMRREAEAIRRKNQDEVAQKEDFLKRSEAYQAAEKQAYEAQQELNLPAPPTPPTPPPPPPEPPKEPSCWEEYQSRNLQNKELDKPRKGEDCWIFIVIQVLAAPFVAPLLFCILYIVASIVITGKPWNEHLFGEEKTSMIIMAIATLIVYVFITSIIIHYLVKHDYKIDQENYKIKEIGDRYIEEKKVYEQKCNQHTLLTKKYENLRKQYDSLIEEKRKQIEKQTEEKRKQGEKIITRNNTIIRAKEDISRALKQQEKDETRVQYIFAQADLLARTADELHAKKETLYRANIIPPDYRELDCVLMFHQIFRNDLADTMREAVKIYEERVFRQEVIRGIDRIYSMLGRLASSMSSIENRLVQIRDEVKLMGNDVYQMSQNLANSQSAILKGIQQGQKQNQREIDRYRNEIKRYQDMSRSEQQRFQEQMLTETRASTYATEALKNATDKLVWYEQQKYWKNM